jgi:hypothetical protein
MISSKSPEKLASIRLSLRSLLDYDSHGGNQLKKRLAMNFRTGNEVELSVLARFGHEKEPPHESNSDERRYT